MSLFRSLFGRAPAQETRSAPESQPLDSQEEAQDRRKRQRVNARAHTRVLIVDDSATIVAALEKTLVSTGYTTFQAFDAESAIEIARQEQPELIFLDIVLPGMNGFAALRQMRRDPLTRHIPIIMISGNEAATEQFYANRIGADDFMKKPFSRSEVFAKIEPLLDDDMVPRRRNFSPLEAPLTTPAAPPATAPAPLPAPVAQPLPVSPTTAIHAIAAPFPGADTPATSVATLSPPAPVITQAAPVVETPAVATESVVEAPASPIPVVPTLQPAPPPHPVAAPATPSSAAAPPPTTPVAGAIYTALEARKELTAMGLQYFDQGQFIAAIQRGDKLAFELFVAGGGVDIAAEIDGKTPLQIARENGRTQIFALLRARLAVRKAEEEPMPPE